MPSEKSKNLSDEQKIKKLSEENEKLKSEVDKLKEELDILQGKRILHKERDSVEAAFENQSIHSGLYSKRSYSGYLIETIKNTSIFRVYRKMITYVRRYTFVSTTLKILAFILSILQSGTIFVLAASFFVVSLPFTFIVGYSVLVIAFLGSKKLKRRIKSVTADKNITFFFPAKGRAFDHDSFFSGMAKDIASNGDNIAIVVSPYFFSSKGIDTNENGT